MSTIITLDVSEHVVNSIGIEKFKRLVAEAVVVSLVEAGFMETSEVRRSLGFKTHKESREFLAANGIYKEVPPDEFSADLDMIDSRLNAEG